MFGLVSMSRNGSMKLISSGSGRALDVSSVRGPSLNCTVKPLSDESRSSTSSATKSIRLASRASFAVAALASSIMALASARASSPRVSTNGRIAALVISMAFASAVEVRFSPEPLIGLEAPMDVSGAIAEA